MHKVYFDASVIIAAMLSSSGGSAKLLEFVKLEAIVGVTSQTVVSEVENNAGKIQISRTEVHKFMDECGLLIREEIDAFEMKKFEGFIEDKDVHVVAGAFFTKCDYLVTLDKRHLLNPGVKNQFKYFKIVNPKDMLNIIVGED